MNQNNKLQSQRDKNISSTNNAGASNGDGVATTVSRNSVMLLICVLLISAIGVLWTVMMKQKCDSKSNIFLDQTKIKMELNNQVIGQKLAMEQIEGTLSSRFAHETNADISRIIAIFYHNDATHQYSANHLCSTLAGRIRHRQDSCDRDI